MLAKLVFSINTTKATENRTENGSNGKKGGSNYDKSPNASKRVAIEGMQAISRKQKIAILFDTVSAAEEEEDSEGGTNNHNKNTYNKDNQGDKIEGAAMTKATMIRARKETRQTVADTTARKWTIQGWRRTKTTEKEKTQVGRRRKWRTATNWHGSTQ
jgi:hypothetical protein